MPAALRWLLTAVALAGAAWALIVPAFQVPDEDAHFAYAQTLAELHRRPFDDGRPAAQAEKSAEQDLAEQESGFLSSYQRVEMDPSWSEAAQARWLAAHASRRDGGGANPARANQPGYYLYVLPAYWAASGGTVLDRLFLMRLWSVTLALVLTAGAWLLAGELFGRDRPSSSWPPRSPDCGRWRASSRPPSRPTRRCSRSPRCGCGSRRARCAAPGR